MKKLLLLFIFLMPLALFAKFYDGQIIYKNGKTVDLQISFPLNPTAKKLKVKIDGKTQKLVADEIAYFTVAIDKGNSTFLFRRVQIGSIDKNGNLKKLRKGNRGWAIVEKAYKNTIIYDVGTKYGVKKVKGTERMVRVYEAGMDANLIGKPDEDIAFVMFDASKWALRIGLKRAEKYLFDKCPDFTEKINVKEMGRRDVVYQIAEFYDECAEN